MAATTEGDGKIGLFWPVMFHLLNSIGFAHIMPVSLALFTKVAPKAIVATVIGIYYLAFFAANKTVGVIGGWYSTMDTAQFLADACGQRWRWSGRFRGRSSCGDRQASERQCSQPNIAIDCMPTATATPRVFQIAMSWLEQPFSA